MIIKKTIINGVYLFNFKNFQDKRGIFSRRYCKEKLKNKNIHFDIKQVNYAFNKTIYTLRGFHYQKKPFSEKKIMMCLSGSIMLQAVDINKNSKTYLKKIKIILTSKNNVGVLISKNCANAYLTLEKSTTILYLMSNFYNKNKSFGIRYNDPFFNFKWTKKPKIISKKDLSFKDYKK